MPRFMLPAACTSYIEPCRAYTAAALVSMMIISTMTSAMPSFLGRARGCRAALVILVIHRIRKEDFRTDGPHARYEELRICRPRTLLKGQHRVGQRKPLKMGACSIAFHRARTQ